MFSQSLPSIYPSGKDYRPKQAGLNGIAQAFLIRQAGD
jgi:hypothetical protein